MDLDFQLILIFNSTLFSKLGRNLAYLDPGSGSYFIQLLLASLMGALFILGVYRKKVTDFFRNLFSNREDDDEPGE
jgi:hypothetical protein